MQLTNSIFSVPEYNDKPSAWMEHIPFAFFSGDMLKPKIFVELGTHHGNSYFAFCQTFAQSNINTRAYAIDHWKGDEQAGYFDHSVFKYVNNINEQYFSDFSHLLRMSFDDAVDRFEDGSIDLLHIDGFHSYEAVKHDFETWLPKMSERGVILFHDTEVRDEGFGVWKLMDEIENKYPFFNFKHGYGLGVVCTGSKVDENFLRFIENANSNTFILQLFENLGKKVKLVEQNSQLAKERKNLNSTVEELENKLKRNQQIIQNQKAENKKLFGDLKKLESTKIHVAKEAERLKLVLAQLTASWSWRITKPLRALNFHTLKRLRLLPQVRRIEKSVLFDADFYMQNNPDVSMSKQNPARHYLLYGGFEGRNPSEDFDSAFYLNQWPDVKSSGINPLIHYLNYGKSKAYPTKPYQLNEAGCLAKADITDLASEAMATPNFKIAVVLHLYYIDLASEFISYLKNIPVPFDLFISTPHDKEDIQKLFTEKLSNVQTFVKTLDNRGRDIYPFLSFLKDELMQYDLVCKIHTKHSGHSLSLIGWRRYLLNNLLGSTPIVNRIIAEFANNKKVGSIWPVTFPYLTYLNLDKAWGTEKGNANNFEKAKYFFPELGLTDPSQNIEFPAGSMLWFRPIALDLINEKKIEASDFEKETGQLDGTLAHAIERLFGEIITHAGFGNKTVFFPEKKVRQTINQHPAIGNPKRILFIAHDLFRAGAEILLLSLLRWLNRHTNVKIFVLAIKAGIDGGALYMAYKEVAEIFLWEEMTSRQDLEKAIRALQKEIGEIDLIYGNTIVSPNLYPLLTIFKAPYISHIHELEESIQRYTTTEVRDSWKQYSKIHIACSQPVAENIIKNHGIPKSDIRCVNAFIQPVITELPEKMLQRAKNGLPQNKTIIWSCGTIYWRKGTDIFIETAKILQERGVENFVFYWIGMNQWDLEKEEWGEWSTWEAYIEKHELKDKISFLGESENPRELFTAGDIFYLSSREDPFPLVCLEAAECGLPVVCFKDGGGMPGFIEDDAGFIVPFLDVDKAADAIENLIVDQSLRNKKGACARKKLFQRHTVDIAAPEILKICHSVMNSKPLVSVIVPVYNHANFLRDRIDSILNQSFRDFEIIILDDTSMDNSYKVAMSYNWHPSISIHKNEHNSGSPFVQWQKGVKLATGKYIWIAEGDDMADPDFLKALLPAFNDEEVVISYSASHRINEDGEVYENHYLNVGHYDNLNYPKVKWENDYINSAREEVINAISIRNTIPNVSGVLFKAQAIKKVDFEACINFRNAGDWFAYASLLQSGKISYNSNHLNYHRVHTDSVVARNKLDPANTIPDYFEMHKYILSNFNINQDVFDLMTQSVINGLRHIWPQLTDDELATLYNSSELKQVFSNKQHT